MKPRTKMQKQVDSLFRELPRITEKQKAFAINKLFEKECMICKTRCWCSCCGATFENRGYKKGSKVVCPSCGMDIIAVKTTKRKINENVYYTIPMVRSGFQIFRHFIVNKYMAKVPESIDGCQEPEYTFTEVVQQWLDENGNSVYVARPRSMNGYYSDLWVTTKPMEIRESRGYYNHYDICSKVVYPGNVLPILRKYGFTYRINANLYNLSVRLLTNNEAEMLIKTKQYELLKYYHLRHHTNIPRIHAVRICNRNNYIVKDASMWEDYLDLLEYFHLDTHNAHYICPKDLKKEHDRLMKKKARIEAQKERERKKREAARNEAKYKKDKAAFFGLCFGDDDITICVLESVQSFVDEGESMKHCVYTSEYYKKKDSLIMSARDREGKRLETIEISLKTFKVLQCRGKNNAETEHHNHILELVEKNKNQIIKRAS